MWQLSRVEFADIAGWVDDDHEAALAALAKHANKPSDETYRTGSLGLNPARLLDLAGQAQQDAARHDPRSFFEVHYVPVRLVEDRGKRGLVTGFYEPELVASRTETPDHTTPLLRRPDDLVAINDSNRPNGLDRSYRFARQLPDGRLAEYPDRAAINAGALAGRGLEIAWVADAVDAFFVHVQGAARLTFSDGTAARITYDGKSGHPFTAIGKLLVERNQIAAETVSMQSIRQWLADHPEEAPVLIAENRSYIFFKEMPTGAPGEGPIAAAKIPLTAGRSLAVDRLIHTFATPIFVSADAVNGTRFRRLMIAQETGSAIVGPARGDIFFGTGEAAGEAAGAVKSPCDFIVLVPRDIADTLPAYWEP